MLHWRILVALFLAISIKSSVLGNDQPCSRLLFASEYTHEVDLGESLAFRYRLDALDTYNQSWPDAISVQMIYRGIGWIGFAVAADEKGQMLGSEAVIGFPGEPNSLTNPGKYIINGKSASGVTIMDDEQQTLVNASIFQDDACGETVLTFTKKLREPGQLAINAVGNETENTFLWAVGSSNSVSYHADRDSFTVNLGGDNKSTNNSSSLTRHPIIEHKPEVSIGHENPNKDPTKTPNSQDRGPAEPETANSDYPNQLALGESLTFHYRLETLDNPDNEGDAIAITSSTPNAISIQMVYKGLGWIGFAIADNGDGQMVGSEAIIGLPGEPNSLTNPGKYSVGGKSIAGVELMDDTEQTLIDASITQDVASGETTLTFTKLLHEPGQLSINALGNGTDSNTFLWATGLGNPLGYHGNRAAFTLNLESGASAGIAGGGKDYKRIFMIHGVLAALGWALLTPVAVAASWLRDLMPPGKAWFRVHVSCNVLCFALTVTTFILAVVSKFQQDRDHRPSENTHFVTGWVITFVAAGQVMCGALRPHVRDGSNREANNRTPDGEEDGVKTDNDAADRRNNNNKSNGSKTKIRIFWEVGHRCCGIGLLAVALWQIDTGLKLYHETYGSPRSYLDVYWIWIGALSGVVFALSIYQGYRRSRRRRPAVREEENAGEIEESEEGALYTIKI